MTDIQSSPQAKDADSLLPGLVRGGAIVGTLLWGFTLLAFLGALSGPASVNALGPLLILIVATPFFVLFVLPALLFSIFGGLSGARVGATLLVCGAVLVALAVGAPMLR
jgi:hypothetical protein